MGAARHMTRIPIALLALGTTAATSPGALPTSTLVLIGLAIAAAVLLRGVVLRRQVRKRSSRRRGDDDVAVAGGGAGERSDRERDGGDWGDTGGDGGGDGD